MKLTDWIYLIALVVVVLTLVQAMRQWLRRKADYVSLRKRVHQQTDKYAFLIDRKFRVKETNFYELNKNIQDDQPYFLGNVLHCQEGCESGLCGTGISCQTCPIRMVIKNAFKLRRSFDHIEATLHLYDENHEVNQVDVRVDGELVYVGREPHLFVTALKRTV
jgi:hypothetical protein